MAEPIHKVNKRCVADMGEKSRDDDAGEDQAVEHEDDDEHKRPPDKCWDNAERNNLGLFCLDVVGTGTFGLSGHVYSS